jgi:hypothetical protein
MAVDMKAAATADEGGLAALMVSDRMGVNPMRFGGIKSRLKFWTL